jgi:hypothetical protein
MVNDRHDSLRALVSALLLASIPLPAAAASSAAPPATGTSHATPPQSSHAAPARSSHAAPDAGSHAAPDAGSHAAPAPGSPAAPDPGSSSPDVPTQPSGERRSPTRPPEQLPLTEHPTAEPTSPAPVNLSGRVLEAGSRDPLEDVSLVLDGVDLSADSDADGRFSFTGVPNGEHRIRLSLPNYETLATTVTLSAGQRTEATYYLRRRSDRPRALEVRTKRDQEEVAQHTIQIEEVRRIPGTYGDAIRVIQNLPGMARVPFGLGALVVRGTGPNDTGTYIDGMRVPIIFHFGGLVSVFNSSLLDRVDYLPGGYSVRYGRNIGGVVDVTTKDEIPDRLHGYAEVDLFNSSFFVQGSTKGKLGYSLSARRSYIDYIVEPILERSQGLLVQFPRYWDAQLKFDYRPSSRDALQLMAFASDDRFKFLGSTEGADEQSAQSATFGTYVTAVRAKARWTHTFSGALNNRIDVSAGPDLRNVQFGTGEISFPTPTLYLRDEAAWTVRKNFKLRGGIDLLAYRPTFDIDLPAQEGIPDSAVSLHESAYGFSPSPYLEAEVTIADQLKVFPGVRYDPLYVIDQYSASSIDPRIAFRSKVADDTVIKGSVGRYSQFPQPQNFFKDVGEPSLKPEHAIQASLGLEHDFTKLIHLDVVGYYSSLYDQVVQGPGGGFARFFQLAATGRVNENDGPAYTNNGSGRNYGLEVLLRHDFTEQFFGWISYTFSRAERRSSDDEDYHLFRLDQPHILTVIASYRLPWRLEVSGRFRYSSGTAYTPVLNAYQDLDDHAWRAVYGEEDSVRNDPFHALDLRIQKDWIFRLWKMQLYLDVQNVYNRENPAATFYSFDFRDRIVVSDLPILPVLGVRGDF